MKEQPLLTCQSENVKADGKVDFESYLRVYISDRLAGTAGCFVGTAAYRYFCVSDTQLSRGNTGRKTVSRCRFYTCRWPVNP